ncbi:hypothetical protein [Paenibacillus sp. FSL H3-0333]|uniref:hypothetical protein n=1 Tax=Paenibacillus sp. FSL H3-0333 TaxID=2921373 RepID=UPI0030F6D9EA
MSGEYALRYLKEHLLGKKQEVEYYEQRNDNTVARTITKVKHQIYDLEFAIELLEEYQN